MAAQYKPFLRNIACKTALRQKATLPEAGEKLLTRLEIAPAHHLKENVRNPQVAAGLAAK